MNAWPLLTAGLQRAGESFVIVTVVATRGSTPREPGARLLVTRDDVIGTIGGGQLEHQCTALACRWFVARTPARSFVRRFTLGASLGQCCGGVADVLFEQVETDAAWVGEAEAYWRCGEPFLVATVLAPERVDKFVADERSAHTLPRFLQRQASQLAEGPPAIVRTTVETEPKLRATAIIEKVCEDNREIVIFGAGHVGTALVHILAPLDARIRWIDSREGIFPEPMRRNVEVCVVPEPFRLVPALAPGSVVMVMTHSHPQDLAICAELLRREDLAFCGLIGSVSKRRQFERRLRKLGLDDAALGRLCCPIGVPGIGGKAPAEIAIAVAAQVLQIRSAACPGQRRDQSGDALRARR